MKTNILLDIDGVLSNFNSEFSNFLNKNYGAKLDPDSEPKSYVIQNWDPSLKDIDIDEASVRWIMDGGMLNMFPYEGAKEFVYSLMKLANVHIVTARIGDFKKDFPNTIKNKIINDTYKWFYKHNIPTNDKITFEHNKVDFCKNNGISIMIEDKLTTAIGASENGISTVLMNRGWNQSSKIFGVYRAHNYQEILDLVEKLIK